MATYTFGNNVETTGFVEVTGTNPPRRADTGDILTLLVRRADDLTALASTTIEAGTGYWNYTTTDIPIIQVSGDNGATWKTQISLEAQIGGANSGATSQQALTVANSANTKADQAIAAANSGGVTFQHATGSVGPAKIFTLAQIHARDDQVLIPSDQLTGISDVGKSGLSADITDANQPDGVVLLDDSGFIPAAFLQAGGGGGGSGQKFIFQNSDGTWPARTTVSTDPTECVEYVPAYDPTKRPAIGTDAATAYVMNASLLRPGDKLRNLQPAA